MIAGHTVEYVNSVILKVESGDNSGGLNIKRSHRTWTNQHVHSLYWQQNAGADWCRSMMYRNSECFHVFYTANTSLAISQPLSFSSRNSLPAFASSRKLVEAAILFLTNVSYRDKSCECLHEWKCEIIHQHASISELSVFHLFFRWLSLYIRKLFYASLHTSQDL